MELSHALSDAVLTLAGIFVFLKYLKPLAPAKRLLWSMFILSISSASFLGVFRFLGYPQSGAVSEIFQHLAATLGAIGLVLVNYLNLNNKEINKKQLLPMVVLSIFVFLGIELSQQKGIIQWASMIAMPMVLMIGILGLIKGQKKRSIWLILAVFVLIMATFNNRIAVQIHLNDIDTYHYLLAISVLCFGQAANEHKGNTKG